MSSNSLETNIKIIKQLLELEHEIQDPFFIQKLKQILEKQQSNNKNQNDNYNNALAEITNFKNFYIQEIVNIQIQSLQLTTDTVPSQKVNRLFIDGCFDLMHSGHYNAIRQAKMFAHTLVVGVISDEQIRLKKGPNILDIEERLELVKCCKWVDEVVAIDQYDPDIPLLDKLNCSHSAHDDMIVGADGKDAYGQIKQAGRMLIFKRTEGISTTDIVGRLLQMTKEHLNQQDEAKLLRKMSEDENELGIQASQLDHKVKNISESQEQQINQQQNLEIKEKQYVSQLPKVKLLNTTRRIRQFSSGREITSQDKVIYIDGSFDVLHLGHVKILEKARKLGTFLLVGLHDDEIINAKKGSNFPVLNIQERTLNLLANKNVDEVIIGAPWKITENLIKNFNISLVVEGTCSKQSDDVNIPKDDPYEVPKKMGIYQQIESYPRTIEQIIKRIIDNRLFYIEAQKKKELKLQQYYKQENFQVKEVFEQKEKEQKQN